MVNDADEDSPPQTSPHHDAEDAQDTIEERRLIRDVSVFSEQCDEQENDQWVGHRQQKRGYEVLQIILGATSHLFQFRDGVGRISI